VDSLWQKKDAECVHVDEMEEEKEGFDIMLLIIPAVLYMLFVAVKGPSHEILILKGNRLMRFLF
jgi:hypothetical protein